MGSEDKTTSMDRISQEILKTGDLMPQAQSVYNGDNRDRIQHQNNELTNARKIFVGGLPADLTIIEFKSYFEKFGPIEDVVVMCDKESNRPRGFGFVTFDSLETANNVLKKRFYELKSKRVEVKKAVSKERMSRNNYSYNNYNYTYDAAFNGNNLGYGSFSGYYYGTNVYGYGLGYEGLSNVYYPYQSPNISYYSNSFQTYQAYPYQSLYDYGNTCYQSPNFYGNSPLASKNSHKNRNRTSIVVKRNLNVKDCGDSDVVRRNSSLHLASNGVGKEKCDDLRQRDSIDEESVVICEGDRVDINEGLSNSRGVNGDGEGDCAEVIEALSLCGDGSRKEMGRNGRSSECANESL